MSSLTFNFVGDVMLGELFEQYKTGVKSRVADRGIDPFVHCREEFENSDLNVANLECVVADCSDKDEPFSEFVRVPTSFADLLSENHIHIVNLANNHSLDHGNDAFRQMVKVLNSKEIRTFGYSPNSLFQEECMVTVVRGFKIGFLGYNLSNLPYLKVLDISKSINNIVAREKKKVDLLVLSLHWAYEFVSFPAWRFVSLGKGFIERGADIIYGHHPHQLQGVVRYQGKIFAPSLGNFVFGRQFRKCRITAILKVKIDRSTKQLDYHVMPYYVNADFQPKKCARHERTVKKLNSLVDNIVNCTDRSGRKWDRKAFLVSQLNHLRNRIRVRLIFVLRILNYRPYIQKIIRKKLGRQSSYA